MKNILYIIVIAALVGATHYLDGCFTKKEKAPVTQYLNPMLDTVKHYKDLYNNTHAQLNLEINNRDVLYKLHKEEMDSVVRRANVKIKQLQEIQQIDAWAKGYFTTQLRPAYIPDTTNGIKITPTGNTYTYNYFQWRDSFMQMNGVIDSENVSVSYSMDLPIRTSLIWHRKHHFLSIGWGKKTYVLDAYSDNPNVNITGLQGLKIN